MQPSRTPSDHYRDAVRLLAAAESPGVDTDIARIAALAAIGHVLLASAPRRARRDRTASVEHGGGGVLHRWITGHDQDGDQHG
jgi:hypothetical protein